MQALKGCKTGFRIKILGMHICLLLNKDFERDMSFIPFILPFFCYRILSYGKKGINLQDIFHHDKTVQINIVEYSYRIFVRMACLVCRIAYLIWYCVYWILVCEMAYLVCEMTYLVFGSVF